MVKEEIAMGRVGAVEVSRWREEIVMATEALGVKENTAEVVILHRGSCLNRIGDPMCHQKELPIVGRVQVLLVVEMLKGILNQIETPRDILDVGTVTKANNGTLNLIVKYQLLPAIEMMVVVVGLVVVAEVILQEQP